MIVFSGLVWQSYIFPLTVLLAVSDDLLRGALLGVVSGLIVGAIFLPMMQTPDALGRGLLLGILAALVVSVIELARIGQVTGASLGSILRAFQGPYNTILGQMILQGVTRVIYALAGGAAIGVASLVPGDVIKGALLGLLMGAVIGGLLYALLVELNIFLSVSLFRILVGFVVWALVTSLVSDK
ncbi:MAG: hypothetical protein D6706_20700 [Chloroflexi bacterium]|nr:MAG: hypothetical protein D6706_20700 [Chloroflexota bacterium]